MVKASIFLLVTAVFTVLVAGEVALDLPDPAIPGVAMSGTLRITDPAADVQSVQLPHVDGLELKMSGQNGSQTSIVNGARSTVIEVGLILRASEKGMLAVPPVTVQLADGTTMSTQATSLRVDTGDERLIGNAIAELVFDPPTIVPGQQTALVYRIFLRRGEVSTLGIGPPEGAILLGERTISSSRAFDVSGRPWTVTTITWPITCSSPGSHVVRGQQEYQQSVGSGFFDQRVTRHQVAVPAATLTVEPMPAAGRPDDFSGLIGPLSVEAALERERVSAGEGTVLTVTVQSRQGDLVKRPVLSVTGAQLYVKDDAVSDGQRSFRWDIVPSAAAPVAIPAVTFAFFDPASRGYQRASSMPLTLTVIPGRSRELGIAGATLAAPSETALPVVSGPLLPAPLRGAVLPTPPSWGAAAAVAVGLLMGAMLPVVGWLRSRSRGPHRGRTLRAARQDPQELAAALSRLMPALETEAQRAAATALQSAIDRHRFGDEALPDLEAWIRILEVVA